MKFDVEDKNRCRLVCVKFHLNRCRFAAAVAKCLGGSLFWDTVYKREPVLTLRVTRGHYRWCHSTGDKILYIFFSQDHMPISRRFGVTAKKKRNFRKRELVAMATSLENSKIEVQIVHLQPQRNRTVKTA